MPTPPALQTRFLHAIEYSRLILQMAAFLYPGATWDALSTDQRSAAAVAADELLTNARWRLESAAFATSFASPPLEGELQPAPAGTVLGNKLPLDEAAEAAGTPAAPPGQYL